MRLRAARPLVLALITVLLLTATASAAASAPASVEPSVDASAAPQPAINPKPATGWQVEAPSAIMIEATGGQVLFEKNADEKRAPASMTKLMTLVLTFEAIRDGRVNMDTIVTASPEACSFGGTQIWLKPGEQFKLQDLIKAITIGSANDAAAAVAEHIGGSIPGFADMMNKKAADLGMTNSHFVNPHGLDADGHYTTARDMAILAKYALTMPDILKYTQIWQDYIRDGKSWLVNTNRMVRHYSGCDGLKTGKTNNSGFCVTATAKRDSARYIAVVMGAASSQVRFDDAARLFNTAFATYRAVPVARKGDVVKTVIVRRGAVEEVKAIVPEDFVVTIERGQEKGMEQTMTVQDELIAPVKEGQACGEMVVKLNGKEIARTSLVAATPVPRLGVFASIWRSLKSIVRVGR